MSLVYCNTQAFPDDLVWQLGEKLGAELRPGSIAAILGRAIFPCHGLTKLQELGVPTTWHPSTPLYMYELRDIEPRAPQCDEFHAGLLRARTSEDSSSRN